MTARRAPARPGGGDPAERLELEVHAAMLTLVQRAPMFADLRAAGIAEDLVQDVMVTLRERGDLTSGRIADPLGYAATCVRNLAARTYARDRELATDLGEGGLAVPAVGADVATLVQQRMELDEAMDAVVVLNHLLKGLAPLDFEIVRAEVMREDQKSLCGRLGLSRATFYRRKAGALSSFVIKVADHAGLTPCPEHVEALLAAAGGSGFAAAAAASEHATGCDQCRQTIRCLQAARHGLAITGPIPLAAGGVHHGLVDRLGEAVHVVLDTARAVAARAPDPTPMAPAGRAVAATVALACAGGGGVYCATAGLPHGLSSPFARHQAAHRTEASQAERARRSSRSSAAGSTSRASVSSVFAGAAAEKAGVVHAVSASSPKRAATPEFGSRATRRSASVREREFARGTAARSAATSATREFGGASTTSSSRSAVTPEFSTSSGAATQRSGSSSGGSASGEFG